VKPKNHFSLIETDCVLCTVRTEAEGTSEHPLLKRISYELRTNIDV
jgi:hypothetical protein